MDQVNPPPFFRLTITHKVTADAHVFAVKERADYLAYCRYIRCAPFRVVIEHDMARDIGGVDATFVRDSVRHALFPHAALVEVSWVDDSEGS